MQTGEDQTELLSRYLAEHEDDPTDALEMYFKRLATAESLDDEQVPEGPELSLCPSRWFGRI